MVAASRCFKILLRCKGTFNFRSSRLVRGVGNRVAIRHYPPDNYFSSIPVGLPCCIRLFYPIVSKIIGNYNSLATQAAPDDEEVADEVLNQILATYQNTPKLSRERCNAYVHKLCKAGNLSMAIRLLQSLRDKGRAGQVDEMVHEFTSMKEAGFVPDCITYNTLLNNLRKVGRVDLCLVFFREMGDSGIEPDLLTYREMIETFGRSGNTEEALRLFSEMKQRKIRPSIYIYRSLIDILKKAGKVDLALSFLEEMNSSLSDIAGSEDFKQKRR